MIFRLVTLLFSIGLALAGAGCASNPELKATTEATVVLDGVKKKGALTVDLLTEVRIQLPPVETAGYSWQLFSADFRYLKQLSEVTAEGSPPVAKVKFLSVRTGRTLLRFLLVKATDSKETDPIDSQEILLTIERGALAK